LTLSLPEMVMYGLTFKSIVSHTNFLAVNGLLQPEKIKKRKKKNLGGYSQNFLGQILKIFITLTWILELISHQK
jgi:hypothetical protein